MLSLNSTSSKVALALLVFAAIAQVCGAHFHLSHLSAAIGAALEHVCGLQ